MENILTVSGLDKSFLGHRVLDNLNLEVRQGEIFGLLGLNGAGKTTLFKCILRLLHYDKGDILYKNEAVTPRIIHSSIGYLPEFYLPPGELKGREYLKLLSFAVKGKPVDVDQLLKRTDLDPQKMIGDYSRGMIQRLGLAISLLKAPEFIILDEPTLGLDPVSRLSLLNWLKELNAEGRTILLASHDFAQVAKLCQRIAILHDNTIKYSGTISELLAKFSANDLEEAFLKQIGEKNE